MSGPTVADELIAKSQRQRKMACELLNYVRARMAPGLALTPADRAELIQRAEGLENAIEICDGAIASFEAIMAHRAGKAG